MEIVIDGIMKVDSNQKPEEAYQSLYHLAINNGYTVTRLLWFNRIKEIGIYTSNNCSKTGKLTYYNNQLNKVEIVETYYKEIWKAKP